MKISLDNLKSALKRDEMRIIFGGCGSGTTYNGGGGGGYVCQDECSSHWDCNCNNDRYGFPQQCLQIVCPGSFTRSKKTCRT